jgi:hypothetical protein
MAVHSSSIFNYKNHVHTPTYLTLTETKPWQGSGIYDGIYILAYQKTKGAFSDKQPT